MSIIWVIISALLLLDLVWWRTADRLLRKAGFGGRVRLLHSLFFGVQLAGLLTVILSRRSELWDWLPKAMTAAVYLWHLLILPLLIPLLAIGAIVALVCWVIRKIRAREAARTRLPNRRHWNEPSRIPRRHRRVHAAIIHRRPDRDRPPAVGTIPSPPDDHRHSRSARRPRWPHHRARQRHARGPLHPKRGPPRDERRGERSPFRSGPRDRRPDQRRRSTSCPKESTRSGASMRGPVFT